MNAYCGYTYLDKNQDVDRDSPFIHQKIVELRCHYLYGLCMRKLQASLFGDAIFSIEIMLLCIGHLESKKKCNVIIQS